mgnify:CR=1 FL=1
MNVNRPPLRRLPRKVRDRGALQRRDARRCDIERLRSKLSEMTGSEVHLNILEIRKPEIDAKLIAENIAQQLERRVAFRRAMKRAVQSAIRLGAQGIRINCGGRLGGAEIARTEWYREGRVPLHTLRADIVNQWGGKVWSLYHKKYKKQLFYNNPAHQPANIGYRKALRALHRPIRRQHGSTRLLTKPPSAALWTAQ